MDMMCSVYTTSDFCIFRFCFYFVKRILRVHEALRIAPNLIMPLSNTHYILHLPLEAQVHISTTCRSEHTHHVCTIFSKTIQYYDRLWFINKQIKFKWHHKWPIELLIYFKCSDFVRMHSNIYVGYTLCDSASVHCICCYSATAGLCAMLEHACVCSSDTYISADQIKCQANSIFLHPFFSHAFDMIHNRNVQAISGHVQKTWSLWYH